ncbi:MAG: AgmX/PglI C-terminal domain-containing protein [Gammaproteobacteria bacterium]
MSDQPQSALPRFLGVTSYLPWDNIKSDERPARVLLTLALLLALVSIVVIERVKVPELDRAQAEKLPERLAKLVQERKVEPPPPPPEVKKEEPKEDKPKPEPEQEVKQAREKAEKALSEAKQELAAIQDLARDLASAFDNQPLAKGGSDATSLSRDVLTSRTGKGSSGVNVGAVSSGGGGEGIAGGGKLGDAKVAKVESNISEGPTGATRKSASGKLERTQEEVRRMMDRNNGALQAIYQRALRNNPTLKGAVVLRLVIEADGSVSRCDLISSDLHDEETERKLLARIRAINFGAIEGVAIWDENYTLNFFPS